MKAAQYRESVADAVEAWRREHRNGDETHVVVLDLADTIYLVVAVDLDPDGDVIDSEPIATALTETEAVERGERWVNEHPKGLEEESSSGALSSLLGGS